MSSHIFIRCMVMIIVVAVIALAVISRYTYHQQQGFSKEGYSRLKPIMPDLSGIGNSTLSYKDACQHPKDSNDANLCIQREMLKVSAKQVTWASLTFWLGVAGSCFIAATLYANILAVQSATKAAEAAVRQAEIARKDFAASHRPWIIIHVEVNGDAALLPNNLTLGFKITMKNIGSTPALGVFPIPLVFTHLLDPDYTAGVKERVLLRHSHHENSKFGYAIAPSSEKEFRIQCGFESDHFDKVVKMSMQYINRLDLVTPILVVGVEYQSSDVSEIYNTISYFEISRKRPYISPNTSIIWNFDERYIPESEIVIEESFSIITEMT